MQKSNEIVPYTVRVPEDKKSEIKALAVRLCDQYKLEALTKKLESKPR